MSYPRSLRVVPQTFAVDDLTGQGLIVFETFKARTKFSIHLGVNIDLGLFVKESFKKKESGFSLSQKLINDFDLEIKSGWIKSLEADHDEVYLSFCSPEKKGMRKIKLSLLELLGLWSLENFSLFASKKLIEDCREVKINLHDSEKPLKLDLHKKYGQKYLM